MKFGGETALRAARAYSLTSTMRPGSGYGQRLQQHLLHHSEDRGVGADAERGREDGGEREAGGLAQHAQRELAGPA